jgi:nitronate monooxygenase
MGTRFCATQEAPIHDNIKQFYLNNDERATNLLYRQFKNTARVAKNSVSDLVVHMSQDPNLEFEQIRPYVSGLKGKLALETGDIDAGLITAGQVLGLIHDIPSCEALIQAIIQDAEKLIKQRLTGLIQP